MRRRSRQGGTVSDTTEFENDETLTPSESLDEDELDVDPLEGGVEPPEHWSAGERHGSTAREEAEGEPLDERLAEERPDVPLEDVTRRPYAETPLDELDESVDRTVVPDEPVDGEGTLVAGDEVEREDQQLR